MSTLSELSSAITTGRVEIIDLTAPLSSNTPVLQLPPPFANTIAATLEKVSDFDDAGPMWSWNNLHTGEHTGTHLDAPTHWISGRAGTSVDQIPPGRLVGPAVVLDFTAEAEQDPDFLLTPTHLEAWEAANGTLPAGCWLLLRTGWGSRSSDPVAFANADDAGPHTPGISADGARWLAENSAITGFGVETVGIDAGAAGGFTPPFPAHFYLLGADKYGLTQLRGLDRIPLTGAGRSAPGMAG